MAILLLVAARWALTMRARADSLDGVDGVAASGFAIGAGIFTASFILIKSYNYQFLFLALAIPALCQWSRRSDLPGITARCALTLLMLWMWSGLSGYLYLGMNIFASWVCVGCIASLLMAWLIGQTSVTPGPDAGATGTA